MWRISEGKLRPFDRPVRYREQMLSRLVRALVIAALAAPVAAAPSRQESWLDGTLLSWNESSGTEVPAAPPPVATTDQQRCGPASSHTSLAARAVSHAGWIPFLPFDRVLASGDIEVFGGMRGVTPDCGPAGFNFFVFVGGMYAGTLSPVEMTTAKDGVVGTVRFPPGNIITAEFARYGLTDTECCPSGRVRVTYRIDRRRGRAVIVPMEVRKLR